MFNKKNALLIILCIIMVFSIISYYIIRENIQKTESIDIEDEVDDEVEIKNLVINTEDTKYTENTESIDNTKELNPDIEYIKSKELKFEEEPDGFVSYGDFKLTAYCPCRICCGKWSGGNTASGTKPTSNRTIAVDTNIIPFGTEVMIDGNTYIAEDTGSAIYANRIDIYFDNHQEALNFGVRFAEVLVREN